MFQKLITSNKIKYNIEFSHIYVDELFSQEQIRSVDILKELLLIVDPSSVLTILVDDYNPTRNIFDLNSFLKILHDHGISPNFVASESKLVSYFESFKQTLTSKELRGLEKYISRRKNKLPCSLLVAIWDLIKLGEIKPRGSLFIFNDQKPEDIGTTNIITILPKKYSFSEHRAEKILKSSTFRHALSRIQHVYY